MPKFIKYLFVLGVGIGVFSPVVGFADDFYGSDSGAFESYSEPTPSPGYSTAGDGQTYDDFGNVVQQQNPNGTCYFNPATGTDSCTGGGGTSDAGVASDAQANVDPLTGLAMGSGQCATVDCLNKLNGLSMPGDLDAAVPVKIDPSTGMVQFDDGKGPPPIIDKGVLYDTLKKGDGFDVVQNRFGVFYVGQPDMTPEQQSAANAAVDAMRARVESANNFQSFNPPVVVGGAAPSYSGGGDSGGSFSGSGSGASSSESSSGSSISHTPSYSSHSQPVSAAASDVSEGGAPVATAHPVKYDGDGIVEVRGGGTQEATVQNLRPASEFGSSRVDPEKAFSSDSDAGKYLKPDASMNPRLTQDSSIVGGAEGDKGPHDPSNALAGMFGRSVPVGSATASAEKATAGEPSTLDQKFAEAASRTSPAPGKNSAADDALLDQIDGARTAKAEALKAEYTKDKVEAGNAADQKRYDEQPRRDWTKLETVRAENSRSSEEAAKTETPAFRARPSISEEQLSKSSSSSLSSEFNKDTYTKSMVERAEAKEQERYDQMAKDQPARKWTTSESSVGAEKADDSVTKQTSTLRARPSSQVDDDGKVVTSDSEANAARNAEQNAAREAKWKEFEKQSTAEKNEQPQPKFTARPSLQVGDDGKVITDDKTASRVDSKKEMFKNAERQAAADGKPEIDINSELIPNPLRQTYDACVARSPPGRTRGCGFPPPMYIEK